MKRILFVAEAVTLAQMVRLVTLARALPTDQYELHFASASFPPVVFDGSTFRRHSISSLSPEQVERALARGARLYSPRVLGSYLDDDLRLLDAVEPDLVVGDLRWSLLVSAPLRQVPHAALINAYWSPYRVAGKLPMPDHPLVDWLGESLAARSFRFAMPWVFRHFARPLESLRKSHHLPPLGGLLELLVAGDLTLYPDAPAMIPTRELPSSHHFLGPVLWSPEVPLPPWWDELPDRPSLYVTLGSSGQLKALPRIVAALADLPVNVMVATAGRVALQGLPKNVFAAEYLPGHLAARRSRLVVTNGGSSTGYQALAEGKPVLGLPWNLDQYLAMTVVEQAGAGVALRSSSATAGQIRQCVERALAGDFDVGAARAREALAELDCAKVFRERVAHCLVSKRSRSSA